MEPSVLLLDEPFSSLDYLTKEEMIKLIKNIRKEFNPTVLHITHDFEEAMVLANHVGIINKGRLIQTGSVSEIFREPGDPFVANFVGAKNLFSGEIQNSGDTTIFRTEKNLDIFIGRNIEQDINNAMIRADEIILAKEISDTSATNRLEGTVIDIIHRRGIIEIHIESKHIFNVFITTRSLHEMDIKIGDSINMFFKGSAVHLF